MYRLYYSLTRFKQLKLKRLLISLKLKKKLLYTFSLCVVIRVVICLKSYLKQNFPDSVSN